MKFSCLVANLGHTTSVCQKPETCKACGCHYGTGRFPDLANEDKYDRFERKRVLEMNATEYRVQIAFIREPEVKGDEHTN